jgi:hypothetical protein
MSKLTTIEFHGDTLFAIEEAGAVYVAPKPICDALGIEWRKQRERIQRDPILSEGSTMMGLPSPGGTQETLCLRLDLVNGWLFTIDESRVREEARARVLDYKRECYAALHAHFYGRLAAPVAVSPFDPAREETVPVKRQLVTEARQTFGATAAGSLWFALGLPIVPEMRATGRQTAMDFTYTAVPHGASPSTRGDI